MCYLLTRYFPIFNTQNMKQFFLLTAFAVLIIGCGSKETCTEDKGILTDAEWDNLGIDTLNVAHTGGYNPPFTHDCIFQDETGLKDTLLQSFHTYTLSVPSSSSPYAITCPHWDKVAEMNTPLESHTFSIKTSRSIAPQIQFDGRAGSKKETLYNISVQNVSYPEVSVYEVNSPLDSINVKKIYFAPRKGVIKVELSPSHVWERIN